MSKEKYWRSHLDPKSKFRIHRLDRRNITQSRKAAKPQSRKGKRNKSEMNAADFGENK
jgi:hypothetical protein